jgi:hypothetical protein
LSLGAAARETVAGALEEEAAVLVAVLGVEVVVVSGSIELPIELPAEVVAVAAPVVDVVAGETVAPEDELELP